MERFLERLLTTDQVRALEEGCGIAASVLMERAGRRIADHAAAMVAPGGRIAVLCGPGNNGGDGYVVAARLKERGFDVAVFALGVPRPASPAAAARAKWSDPVGSAEDPAMFAGAGLVIDALFGIGLSRNLDSAAHALVARVNAAGVPVLSVDLPSGVDADTGELRGIAVGAARTVTFFARKVGHALLPGRDLAGEIAVETLDVGADIRLLQSPAAAFLNAPSSWQEDMPRPGAEGHKYRRGHVLVGAGGVAQTGAARLAAMAALRAGAGVVTIAAPEAALPELAAHLTAVMLRPCGGRRELAALMEDRKVTTVVLGPNAGVGAELRGLVEEAAAQDRALVLDADALTSFAGDAPTLASALSATSRPVVLTPHSGEFARLLGEDSAILGLPSKLERARRASAMMGAVIVLKGSDTVIAAPDGRAAVNTTGTPYLATAGSGDVLAGIVGGLLGQGMPGFEAACAGVWIHAAAARRFGPGLIAEDLPHLVPPVLSMLLA